MKNLVLATVVAQEFEPSFSWWYIPVVAVVLLIAVMTIAYRMHHRMVRFPGIAAAITGVVIFILLMNEVRAGLAQVIINHCIKVHGEWTGNSTGATLILILISVVYGVAVFVFANLAKWAAYGKCAFRGGWKFDPEEESRVTEEQRRAERRKNMVIDHIITTTTPTREGEVKALCMTSSLR